MLAAVEASKPKLRGSDVDSMDNVSNVSVASATTQERALSDEHRDKRHDEAGDYFFNIYGQIEWK